MGFGNATRKSYAIRFWASGPAARRFRTFRHTCATTLFRSGWNAVQVQKFLGHSDPGFTLRTCVHLLPEDPAGAGRESGRRPSGAGRGGASGAGQGDNGVTTRPTEISRDRDQTGGA